MRTIDQRASSRLVTAAINLVLLLEEAEELIGTCPRSTMEELDDLIQLEAQRDELLGKAKKVLPQSAWKLIKGRFVR